MICNSGDSHLDAAVNSWLKNDKNPLTRKEVIEDIKNSRWEKLKKVMLHRQKFGTAGLRGFMGAGYMCMNDVVVLQTAQGICSYIQKECSRSQLQNGIVVGYDGRHYSKRFAELTAKVFISSSIPVHLFSVVCPTPLVSFGTILYGAAAGVMVTASHNPKEDNGYKVYWGQGSQIITPHDTNILDEILQCLDIPEENWNIDEIRSHVLVKDCTDEVTSKYMDYIRDSLHEDVLRSNKEAAVDIVYSAMHGVGYDYVVKAFEAANLKSPLSVKQQQNPNPDFPTVKFPNPEEPQCLELSKQLAEQKDIKLVLVNDPDADRLAVAEYEPKFPDGSKANQVGGAGIGIQLSLISLVIAAAAYSGRRTLFRSKSWKVFTGNEMGALLGWWLLDQHYKRHPKSSKDDVYVLASVVSSKMLRAIVSSRGEFVQTLTGFKWMGNTSLLLSQQNKVPVFAFEEAIGYMCDHRVPDKDGVSAAVHVGSLASHLYKKDLSLVEQLQSLYAEFGYHISHNSYFVCHEPATIQKIFRRIRNYHGAGQYPKKVGGCDIIHINDLTAGVKIPEINNPGQHLNVLGTGLDQEYRGGEMVQFECSNGLYVTVRTSGTEPKLKYYTEYVCTAPTIHDQDDMKIKLKGIIQDFIDELIQPKENGLIE